jgi:hypothetical protein
MNGVFFGFTPTLYNEDVRQLESKLRESLEMSVEDYGKKRISLWEEIFMYAAMTVRLL